MALLALVGAVTVGTSALRSMGQEYLPGRIGLAAGITMDSRSPRRLGAPVRVARRLRRPSVTMLVIAALPVIGLLLALTLPRNVPASPKI